VVGIRTASESDIEHVLALFVELHEFTARGVPSRLRIAEAYDEAAIRQHLKQVLEDPEATCLVAVDGGVVGFAEIAIEVPEEDRGVVPARRAHVQSLLVTESRRGEGIGSQLLAAAEQWAGEMGASEVELDHWVFRGDPGAFYELAGYRTISRTLSRSLSGNDARAPDAPVGGETTVVRRANAGDADRLVAWHADPEVARYWDDETFTRDEMLERLDRPDVDAYIIEHQGEPIGYVQAWFEDSTPDEAGLDMFLVPSARGHGFGPDAARTLARWLLGPGGLRRVIVDPYTWNERAVRAWTKAGFHAVEERPPHGEHRYPPVLMAMS
jgi:aminoglycoside 6'-N-acetyltransferase